jgi:RecA/RadA recombinase
VNLDKFNALTPDEKKKYLLERFETPQRMKEIVGEESAKFLVDGILPENSLVTFQGPAKSGKSTFLFHMIKSMQKGNPFMERQTERTPVVYMSEQPRSIMLKQLADAGMQLEEFPDLHICCSENNWALDWEAGFHLAHAMAMGAEAKLIVIDSWGRFAKFKHSDNEFATAPTQERVTMLRGIQADTKACICINQHINKGGQSQGIVNAGMGSSALAQQADYLLSLSGAPLYRDISPDKLQNGNCRAIQGLGRFKPLKLAVELTDAGYVESDFVSKSKGGISWDNLNLTDESIRRTGNARILADHFAVHPDDRNLSERALAKKVGLSPSTVHRLLQNGALQNGAD